MSGRTSIKQLLTAVKAQQQMVEAITQFFLQNQLQYADNLRLLDFKNLKGNLPSAGAADMVRRMIEDTNKELAAAALPVTGDAFESMQLLAKVLRKEDPAQHVELEPKLGTFSLEGLSRDCWHKGFVFNILKFSPRA